MSPLNSIRYRGIIQWQYHGLQNRSWGFESLFPCRPQPAWLRAFKFFRVIFVWYFFELLFNVWYSCDTIFDKKKTARTSKHYAKICERLRWAVWYSSYGGYGAPMGRIPNGPLTVRSVKRRTSMKKIRKSSLRISTTFYPLMLIHTYAPGNFCHSHHSAG